MSRRKDPYGEGYTFRGDTDWRAEQRAKEKAEREEMMRKIGEYTVADVVEIHKTMLQQDALLERLTKAGVTYSRVVDFDNDKIVIGGGGSGATRVERPEFSVNIGDMVVISEETKQIVEVADRTQLGEIVTISKIIDYNRVEVGSITGSRVLRMCDAFTANVGEEWLAAPEGVLIHKIERPVAQEQTDYAPVHWDEIGGLAAVKQELQEALVLLRGDNRRMAQLYGIPQPKGLLLWGPPGNGKTMLGRAVATELAGNTQQFHYIKGPEILSKFVGQSEERIRNIFLKAREGHNQTGRPSIIFIDECDAVMNKRGSGRSSDVERTIVPSFLTEMDGLEQSHAFIMLATNRPDTLDPAIVREGRIDKHILVGEPDYDAIKAIFNHHLSKVPCDVYASSLAEAASEALIGKHELSGAKCVAVIDRAKRFAYRRELEKGVRNGICLADINQAIAEIWEVK